MSDFFKGGDWDCQNHLKVYNGVHLISIHQFKHGSHGELMLDVTVLSTFTATELRLSYKGFVALTVIANTGTLSLKLATCKK